MYILALTEVRIGALRYPTPSQILLRIASLATSDITNARLKAGGGGRSSGGRYQHLALVVSQESYNFLLCDAYIRMKAACAHRIQQPVPLPKPRCGFRISHKRTHVQCA